MNEVVAHKKKRTFAYGSFAEERNHCNAEIFINGEEYFSNLHDTLLTAKKSIYIIGWAINPELCLKRPVSISQGENINTRLMDVLLKKANDNVSIKVLVYNQVPGSMSLDSGHTKTALEGLHENIQVRRHPKNKLTMKIWSHHEKAVVIDECIGYIGGIDLCWGRYDIGDHPITDLPCFNHGSYLRFPGLDYSNDRASDKTDVTDFLQDYIDRNKIPRMPWHDISCKIEGTAVIDICRHFYQRWEFCENHEDKYPLTYDEYPHKINECMDFQFSCQVLRSATHWSTGNPIEEFSILNAIRDVIANAKHYILIENQFFLSSSFQKMELSENTREKYRYKKLVNDVAFYITQRIERSYKENTKFRVYIFIPLIPGFSGKIHKTQALKTLIKYTYRTINRNHGYSIYEKLYKLMGNKVHDYISFFSLRNHSSLHDVPKTEIIYIHSKCLIVDDSSAIIGSANLNDRSLLGYRDSELCVYIKGNDLTESIIDNQKCVVSKLIKSLRIKLFKQHCGPIDDESILDDPLNDTFHMFIKNRAKINTLNYRFIFNCIPDDKYCHIADFYEFDPGEEYLEDLPLLKARYETHKDNIIGHIVEFPLHFLEKEKLNRPIISKEQLLSISLFL